MKHSVPLGLVSAETNGSTTKMSNFTYLTSNLTQGVNTIADNTTDPMPTCKTIFTISRGREILVVSDATISYKISQL